MTLKKKLIALMREVIAEADANPAFRDRIAEALGGESRPARSAGRTPRGPAAAPSRKRPGNRRTPAVIDPVQLAREGEQALRDELAKLDFEQLRDVVADYGMDPGKLVMKWRDPERIVDRIVEVARGRAQKGSAFRPHHEEGGGTADVPGHGVGSPPAESAPSEGAVAPGDGGCPD